MQSHALHENIMERRMKLPNVLWASFILFGLLIALAILLTGNSPKMVVVDMTRAIEVPAAHLARSKLDEAQQHKLMERFTKRLPLVIKAYAVKHRVTIVSARVLAHENALDVTHQIIQETLSELKHEN